MKNIKPTTKIVLITPELAAEYLEKNEKNRPLSEDRVRAYASDMRAGLWHFDPNPISFDITGRLINGQHRLTAIIRSGVAIEMNVTTNAPKKSIEVIDKGKARTAGDTLRLDGVLNSNNSAAIARRILAYNEMPGLSLDGSKPIRVQATPMQVIEFVRANLEMIEDLVRRASHIYGQGTMKLLKVPEIAVLLHILSPRDRAERFMLQVISGMGLNEATPEFALRKVIEKVRYDKMHYTETQLTQLVIIAFNKYLKGERCEVLRLPNKRA